jgi:hypothetical protein
VGLEGLGQLQKIHLIGTRSRDLPACNIVPQPTTLPRAPLITITMTPIQYIYVEARRLTLRKMWQARAVLIQFSIPSYIPADTGMLII